MWRNFGCEGFECRGAELADSIDERELLRRHPWRAQGGEGDEGEAQEGVSQVASSGNGRGRLGDATDGRETGIGLHDAHGGGRLRETAITERCAQQGDGR